MKAWLRSHYKTILALLFSLLYYVVLCAICTDYISFDTDGYEYNVLVAVLYFLILPIAAALPVLLYELVKYINRK